ncbi:hypothetical protein CDL15_Pgr019911 [Punica granatum]|uniref:non-specific serine/threonine protein kinase n=1 Tax=Punica granatum TaxID=22663 RepID=A0A218VQ24_PUNGR|nr:hypothetical protein CDL15_Pgr019911 [Punica granatum]
MTISKFGAMRFRVFCPQSMMSSSFFFSFLFFTGLVFPLRYCDASEENDQYRKCSQRFICGDKINVTYPFWGMVDRPRYCGREGFELQCENGFTSMVFEDQRYTVFNISQIHRTMHLARQDLLKDPCLPDHYRNSTIYNQRLLNYTGAVKNISIFYGCMVPDSDPSKWLPGVFPCPFEGDRPTVAFVDDSLREGPPPELNSCRTNIKVPVLDGPRQGRITGLSLFDVLHRGFVMEYGVDKECQVCLLSRGICGRTNSSSSEFFCSHPDAKHTSVGLKVAIGVGAGVGTAIILVGLFLFLRHRNRRKSGHHSYVVSRSMSSAFSSRTDFEKGGLYCGLPIFDYEELRDATNNFDQQKELGDGGFGTVFHGKLKDGREVAVKRLYENNYKRVEQFMNEVEILARLRHPNLVILYGCTSRQSHRLLLVYEYVPNGTVADHLHGDLAKPGSLPWSTRLNIAIETASALVYLHASDIIHRDVKTNNILLDENFSVKVADFGLSRLFPFNVTHVSTAPQGTPGYVDPEYHQCYQLTEKSDVYSFGVVLMELISSLPAVDIMRHRHEINLSTMAVNKIHTGALHELVDPNLGFESNCDMRKMITAVAELGFQCLQNAKEMRPSMAEVLRTLTDIQKQDSDGEKKAEENDDAVLLKANPMVLSPDSVAVKWVSTSTTPNASS